MITKKPVVLAILDGWGLAPNDPGNAVIKANMQFVESLKKDYPWVEAHASGEWVGLPEGQMGNSEVGHIHLGAGRIKYESLSLINKAIKDNDFEKNQEIQNTIEFVKKNNSALHIMGLFSDGGVHSHMKHMFAAFEAAAKAGLKEIYIHLFTDGRDTKPKVAINYLDELYSLFKKYGVGQVGSISGRYYSMDRDKRMERTAEGYKSLVDRSLSASFTDPYAYINEQYEAGKDDEGILPAYNSSCPDGYVKENDAVIFTNFRPDRAIQMASTFTNKDYLAWSDSSFKDLTYLGDKIYFLSMMEYAESVGSKHVAFKPIEVINGLGEWLSSKGYQQLRIAETEKIAHVTFFFDGGKDYFKNGLATPEEVKLKNASIDLIPSPKVATYDLKPEMSAVEITNKLVERIKENKYDLIVLNYANCDMVGHTGDLEATIKGVKTLDEQLKRLYDAAKLNNYTLIITADHGNAEIMIDKEGGPNKKHTSQPVPIIITDKSIKLRKKDAAIADVAPTICEILGVEKPKEMTQNSLIEW
ncbi:2,3-bisphosphoglycerate-independent phosphoglycerate mutase [Spiroplasma turonicum]|uniref:2,3-bisphosphoglycerate-independent phosphoglycerate mutase n=1 Tax=Spiroplasma turonicum TaxID=216946 RepID=A0A0K1P8I1_9MOLU|nr:2,3-bisphosphoglycerate-independent phosphoglycerate mutase [Spiroplasma turonicum]AKU80212.1 phosphoglyceromutase [Spiroplasma turonicum]ALX71212.1 phosphoglyceromutase [Spiroplasma turonicum]